MIILLNKIKFFTKHLNHHTWQDQEKRRPFTKMINLDQDHLQKRKFAIVDQTNPSN